MSEKYIGIDYLLLPSDVTVSEDPRRLRSLLDEACILFTGVGSKDMVVPVPGDLIEYDDDETKIKHSGLLKKYQVMGFPNGDRSGIYQVVVRQFYEPEQEEHMIRVGIIKL